MTDTRLRADECTNRGKDSANDIYNCLKCFFVNFHDWISVKPFK